MKSLEENLEDVVKPLSLYLVLKEAKENNQSKQEFYIVSTSFMKSVMYRFLQFEDRLQRDHLIYDVDLTKNPYVIKFKQKKTY